MATKRSGDRAHRSRGALDAVAFTAMMALEARQVLIVVRVREGWSVWGAAAVAGAGADRPSLLCGAAELPAGAPRSVRVEPTGNGNWQLSVPPWSRRVGHDRPGQLLALSSRCADGPTVLLVDQPMGAYSRDRLHDVQWAVADAVVAEDEQHREQLREWLWARELHDETLQTAGCASGAVDLGSTESRYWRCDRSGRPSVSDRPSL